MNDTPPPVLPADDWLLVVDKPAGMLSVAGRGPAGEDSLHARVRRRWPDALVVHRLDMATSGLMVFARGERSQRVLWIAFAERAVDKRYVAIVAGQPQPENPDSEGWTTIDLPLAADWPARPRQKIDAANGRPSLTRWRIARDAPSARQGCTRLELCAFRCYEYLKTLLVQCLNDGYATGSMSQAPLKRGHQNPLYVKSSRHAVRFDLF